MGLTTTGIMNLIIIDIFSVLVQNYFCNFLGPYLYHYPWKQKILSGSLILMYCILMLLYQPVLIRPMAVCVVWTSSLVWLIFTFTVRRWTLITMVIMMEQKRKSGDVVERATKSTKRRGCGGWMDQTNTELSSRRPLDLLGPIMYITFT